jgi:hypothetical protein
MCNVYADVDLLYMLHIRDHKLCVGENYRKFAKIVDYHHNWQSIHGKWSLK